ncbi:hypothetical protein GCM10011380_04600 [Sphingomonas metalli]|uniref:Uncharacterized protein n=1 Tax=Sphingomonas metalli TaxID=1779358 RepID=A0A916SX04_9SPHN|nr:hypothetical protein [Sphingomonas metalli]GGB18104.1 hypothetical protein GCM10011380_04600 [Sphingomonas metalli]
MRTITIALAATAGLFATAAIAADGEKSFVHEGYTYTYTSTKDAAGRTVIEGHRLPGGQDFHLVVANGRVEGRSGSAPVAFRVADAKGAATSASGSIAAFGR